MSPIASQIPAATAVLPPKPLPAPLPAPLAAAAPEDANAAFREAMSFLASGVVVVTSCLDGRPWGMTVSSACPVSVEPPTMLVSLNTRTALAHAVAESGRFGVNVLGEEGIEAARFASAPGQPKFLDAGLGIDCSESHPASVMLAGALGHVDCKVVKVIEHETHTLFIGAVTATNIGNLERPLLHYRRMFRQLGEVA